jgi:hypothetical protein
MDNRIKRAVLEHLKGLMDGKMAEKIPAHMHVDEVHELPAKPDVLALGHDEEGDPMAMGEHEEEYEGEGHLPDLKELHSGTDKEMEEVEHEPHMEVPLNVKKHPLFAMKEEKPEDEDEDEDNHSFIAELKRAKKLKE